MASQLSEGRETPSCHPQCEFLMAWPGHVFTLEYQMFFGGRQWVRGERDSDLDTLSGSEAACFCYMEVGRRVGILDRGLGSRGDAEEIGEP